LVYTYLKLLRLKIFLLIRDIVGSLRHGVQKITTGGTDIDPTKTLMDRIVKEQTIPYKSPLYEQGMTQYETNLRKIFTKAQKKNVPVIISELICNIKDQPPFVSVKADTFPTAERAYKIGKQLEKQGDYKDAKVALTLAKDLDALRFRASEEMNEIIHKIADEFDAPVVPMKSLFEQYAGNGLVGNELILEHLHPNIDGYWVMADGFFETMQQHNFIAVNWDTGRIKPMEQYKKDWGITEIDTLAANISIRYLKGSWPFQPKGVPNTSLQNYFPATKAESLAVRILTDSHYSVVSGHAELARYYEDQREYEKAFKEYKAAYYCIPFELDFYKGAVENLIRLEQYTEALQVLLISNRYGHTPFTDKWTGQLLAVAGRYHEAIPFLERARSTTPDDYQLLLNLMKSYELEGNDLKADPIRERLEKEQPQLLRSRIDQSSEVLFAALVKKASSYINDKEYLKALALFEKANEMKETAVTLKWIGLLKLKNGLVDEAVVYLAEAVQKDPQDFETSYNLCNAYIHQKNKQKAAESIQVLENLRPNFQDPQNLRERLKQIE
ncbi:tetratricopeptide repeat protein, partial [candidate division KSB1 bacterium]|nr:tetratricopeptide repeat protein [candidate division KSB1 bacterium]